MLPAMGMSSVDGPREGVGRMLDVAWHMVLPVLALTTVSLGQYVRLARSAVAEVMGESYITTVRAIGFPDRTILMHYALRNALLPVVTVLGLQLGLVLTGAVLTESVFSWPGLGRLIYDAILARDTPSHHGSIHRHVGDRGGGVARDGSSLCRSRPAGEALVIALLWSSLRSRVALAGSSLIILIAVVLAVAAPFLPLPDPSAMEAIPYTPPGAEHWLGTDNFGRDVFSRLVWGTQLALMVAFVSSAIASLLGVVLGSVAGYFGGTVDAVLSRSFRRVPADPLLLPRAPDRRPVRIGDRVHHARDRAHDLAALGADHAGAGAKL